MKKILATILVGCVAGLWSVSAADAKANYEHNCAACHGKDGTGDTKMGKKLKISDMTDAKVQAKMKDEEMAKAIKEGLKENGSLKMKAFGEKLNDEEISALVKYVRAFKK
jgi:mono/diheme cytochrome c family protein